MAETCPTCGAADIPDGTLDAHLALHAPLPPTRHEDLPYPEKLAAYLESWADELPEGDAPSGARWAADIVRQSQSNPTVLNALPADGTYGMSDPGSEPA